MFFLLSLIIISLLLFSIYSQPLLSVFCQFKGNLVLGQNDSNRCNWVFLRVDHSFVTPFHLSFVILLGTSFKCYITYILCLSECNITASGLFWPLGHYSPVNQKIPGELRIWFAGLLGWCLLFFFIALILYFQSCPNFSQIKVMGVFNLTQHCI